MNLKICIVSETIVKPFDEGIKKFAFNVIKTFSKNNKVLGLTRLHTLAESADLPHTKAIPMNKSFIGSHLRRSIRVFRPDIICYIPTACATFFSFWRTRVLKHYGHGARTIMIALQPRRYSWIAPKIIPLMLPDLILTQSFRTAQTLMGFGCNVRTIPTGVNLQTFRPVDNSRKIELRAKYGLSPDKYTVLHVGHINKNRNVHFLGNLQSMDGIQAVIVGSTSTPQDRHLIEELENAGLVCLTEYIDRIEEIYQCADCYLFPVFSDTGCIELPLSIIEAMACNLPIVSTEFAGLPDLFSGQQGLLYARTEQDIISKIETARTIAAPNTRRMAENYSWHEVAKQILFHAGLS